METNPTQPDGCTDGETIVASMHEPGRFAVIFDRHYHELLSYLARRADRTLAEELAEETFVHALPGAAAMTLPTRTHDRGCTGLRRICCASTLALRSGVVVRMRAPWSATKTLGVWRASQNESTLPRECGASLPSCRGWPRRIGKRYCCSR